MAAQAVLTEGTGMAEWVSGIERGTVVWRHPDHPEPIKGRPWAQCSNTPTSNPPGMIPHAWEQRPGGPWVCPACHRVTIALGGKGGVCEDAEHKWGDDNRCTAPGCGIRVIDLYRDRSKIA